MIIPAAIRFTSLHPDAATEFVLVGQDLKSSLRITEDSTLDLPETMRIAHSQSTQNKVITDRHLVQFSLKKRSTAGVEGVCTVNLTMGVPRLGIFDREDIKHLVHHVYEFIGWDDNSVTPAEDYALIHAVLRGQV